MAALPVIGQIANSSGAVQSGAEVTVYLRDTSTLATIYADAGLSTATTNPAVADSLGIVRFYVDDSINLDYIVKTSGGASTLAALQQVDATGRNLIPIFSLGADTTLAAIADNISTVSGISSQVSQVAAIDEEVVVVAAMAEDVQTVAAAPNISDLGQPTYESQSALEAANTTFTDGVIVRTKDGLIFEAVSSGAQVTNAGGQGFKRAYTSIHGGVIRSDGTIKMSLTSVTGTFQVGETITGGTSGVTATVDAVDGAVLTLSSASGFFTHPYVSVSDTETITGGTSGATATTSYVDYWLFIDDSNHTPRGFNDIDTNVTEQYSIAPQRSFSSHSRITAFAVPDETLARVGVVCGPSVNDDNIRIHMSAPMSGIFGVSTSPVFTNDEISSFHASLANISWSSGGKEFVLTHGDCGLSGQMQLTYNYRADSAVEEPFLPGVERVSGTEHRIAQYMELTVHCQTTDGGSTWTLSNREIGRNSDDQTGYSLSFSSQTFTLTHPTIATREFTDDVTITCHGAAGASEWYVSKVLNTTTRTAVEFQIYDIIGAAIVSTVPTNLAFTIKRGMYRVPRVLGGHVSFSLPNTRIDPRDVVSSGGNIWFGTTERTSDVATADDD